MRCYYDTEFLEDGSTIALISIGLVADDGREYYAVNRDMPIRRIRKNPWLMENVVPSLPKAHGPWIFDMPKRWLFNYADACVKPRAQIAAEVGAFILAAPDPQLWADWGAYDHVVLCQLWGRMIDLPEGIPMWTHDLRQELERSGREKQVPSMPGTRSHNALDDAREVKYRYEWLAGQKTVTGLSRAAAAVCDGEPPTMSGNLP
jgi:hypothetical protein